MVARKLENLLTLDYPADKLKVDVVVVSDGSSDGTGAILERFVRGGRVRTLIQPVSRKARQRD